MGFLVAGVRLGGMVGVEVVEAGLVFKEGRSGKETRGKAWLGQEFKALGACARSGA